MTDRELLEAAARAAGIIIDKSSTNGGGMNNTGFDVQGNAMLDWHNGTKWNPLTDDGDALRLAVKLGMLIDVRYTAPEQLRFNDVTYWPTPSKGERMPFSDRDADPCAQARRAIVRAAASLAPKDQP